MKTSALILSFILFSFHQSFGQNLTDERLIVQALDEYQYHPLQENTNSTGKLWERIKKLKIRESAALERVDPYMPIAVPPRDEYSKFPIMVLPKNFPSNMPIYRLGETMPDIGEKPKIHQEPQ